MTNGKARRKGVTGERDIAKRLGGRRVGHAYLKTPVDVAIPKDGPLWAVVSVKNYTIGGSKIAELLKDLEGAAPEFNRYVAFKCKGKWYVAEEIGQFMGDHVGKKDDSDEQE